jgi:hypothetical protein
LGGENAPEGHYNCNDDKYSEVFSYSFTPWSLIIDTPIDNQSGLSDNHALAEILWELTFFGWTEESRQKKADELGNELQDRMREIDSGEITEGPEV